MQAVSEDTAATVLDMQGRPVSGEISARTPLVVLKELVTQIEAGQLILENVMVIGEVPRGSKVSHPTWDNGLTIATAIYFLRTAEHDIMEATRR